MMTVFSSDEIKKLSSILKLIIPAGVSGMPEADLLLNKIDINIFNHVKFIELSKGICDKISSDEIKNEEELNLFKKANFRDYTVFVNLFMILYYSDEVVLSKLGPGSIPPFPNGNFVKEGDIYLLEQVFLREKIYKD